MPNPPSEPTDSASVLTQSDPRWETVTFATPFCCASTVPNWFETVPLLKMLSSPGPSRPTNRLPVWCQVAPDVNTLTRAVAPAAGPASIRPFAVPSVLRICRVPPVTVVSPRNRELSPSNCVMPA
ncbi:hypothetical protein D9M72_232520 [compost metagenome]